MNINDMLHLVASAAKGPVLWLLMVFLLASVFLIGSLIREFVSRRLSKYDVPGFISHLSYCERNQIPDLIKESGLTNVQKNALYSVLETEGLSETMQNETAESLITEVETHYSHILNFSEIVVKLGPMLGLMGTLIPLGPGIMALGQGDMDTLSKSIITAFDTTVVGLISAGFASIISSIRKIWYKRYIEDTQTLIECLFDKINEKGAK